MTEEPEPVCKMQIEITVRTEDLSEGRSYFSYEGPLDDVNLLECMREALMKAFPCMKAGEVRWLAYIGGVDEDYSERPMTDQMKIYLRSITKEG